MLRKQKEEVLIQAQRPVNSEAGVVRELQLTVVNIPQDNRILTNAKVTNPDFEPRTISLHQETKFQVPFLYTSNINCDPEQAVSLGYRTQYGRKMNPPKRF